MWMFIFKIPWLPFCRKVNYRRIVFRFDKLLSVQRAMGFVREFKKMGPLVPFQRERSPLTRENDIQHGYFRQLTVHRMRGALDADGNVSAWEHRQVAMPTGQLLTPPTLGVFLPESMSADRRAAVGEWLGRKTVEWMGAFQARDNAANMPYATSNKCFVQFVNHPGVPISIWRSVGSSYNAFVVESFVDELATAAGRDPMDFRRERLRDHPRHIAVLDKLREVSAWNERSGRNGQRSGYLGMALNECFGTVVGQVAEVSLKGGKIRVNKIHCVVDCGLAVNPDIVRQQMEGGILFGSPAYSHPRTICLTLFP